MYKVIYIYIHIFIYICIYIYMPGGDRRISEPSTVFFYFRVVQTTTLLEKWRTPPKFNSSRLKNGGKGRQAFPIGKVNFQGRAVKLREGRGRLPEDARWTNSCRIFAPATTPGRRLQCCDVLPGQFGRMSEWQIEHFIEQPQRWTLTCHERWNLTGSWSHGLLQSRNLNITDWVVNDKLSNEKTRAPGYLPFFLGDEILHSYMGIIS